MAIIDHWQEKHSSKSGWGRLVLYIFLLIMIIFMMFNAGAFVRGFSNIFFSPDSTEESSP